ncbi:hypothetical protein, partial [Microvirga aerophila]|uniref:hypothetical protein n=1 Tax=Microvirga aerophila TaxID=670291 RepID=UPI001AECD12C
LIVSKDKLNNEAAVLVGSWADAFMGPWLTTASGTFRTGGELQLWIRTSDVDVSERISLPDPFETFGICINRGPTGSPAQGKCDQDIG